MDDWLTNARQPDGIYYALRHYARKFPTLPLYVVENGMPTDNGLPRPDGYTRSEHLRDHIYWVQRAKADGIDVIGYNHGSITDNYEWGSYRPRFGLYTVDARPRRTYRVVIRPLCETSPVGYRHPWERSQKTVAQFSKERA